MNNFLILTQLRDESEYNDFIGKFYHFPKKYLPQFDILPAEFVYYESSKAGEGVYFGSGLITSAPTEDKREPGHYFVEISNYKPFASPVSFKEKSGKLVESESPHYNPQNSVRKIPQFLLEEICLDGKIRLNFKADAHLVKVLGEQLIASEKVGILEIIKNAYDAGASCCKVRLENIPTLPSADIEDYHFPGLPGPVIIIEDDGSGMTRDAIENGWLRPASTIKTKVKEDIKSARKKALEEGKLGTFDRLISEIKKERSGRIPLGEKGVGRFAAHRLGRKLILTTKTPEMAYEYVLEINWDRFDEASGGDLESVGVNLSRQPSSRDYGPTNSGTRLVIYGGRDEFSWDISSIRDLNQSILSINSPNPSPRTQKKRYGFEASLECPQAPDLKNERPLSLFPAIFSFDGLVDENGILEYKLEFSPPRNTPLLPDEITGAGFDLRKIEVSHWKSSEGEIRRPECGSFYLHIDVWYRKKPWIDTTLPDGKSFIEYLTKFGGISIFRDGINVFPAEWGATTDWLSLSKGHIKQGWRMSYYNMIGNLEIDQANNISLTDKTNREGLIENTPFKDLTKLIQAIISSIIENHFVGKRDEFSKLTGEVTRDPKALRDITKQGAALLAEIHEQYPVEEDPYKILGPLGIESGRKERLIDLSRSLKSLQKSIDLIQDAQELLTEQAGYGMAIAVSVHEIAKIASNFYAGVSHVLKMERPDLKKLEELREASASLQVELNRLGPIRAIKNEAPLQFNISKPLNFALEMFKSRFSKNGITIETDVGEGFQVFTRYGSMVQIFSNLLDNCVYWLSTNKGSTKKIKVAIDNRYRTVTVADSGPGIDDVILPYLFQPGYSLRIPASGLGLYICKYYMSHMNGDIYLAGRKTQIPELGGAQFTLDFDRVPSEKEAIVRK